MGMLEYHLRGITGAVDNANVKVVGRLGLGYLFQRPLRGKVHIFIISLSLPHFTFRLAILEAPSGTSGTSIAEPWGGNFLQSGSFVSFVRSPQGVFQKKFCPKIEPNSFCRYIVY
jgi:hypothetical protein